MSTAVDILQAQLATVRAREQDLRDQATSYTAQAATATAAADDQAAIAADLASALDMLQAKAEAAIAERLSAQPTMVAS